jgi:Domain of unknown function (DUF4276)
MVDAGEIRIYFEGDKSLKSGFDAFFKELKARASEKRCRLEFIATGGTPEQDFGIALRTHPKCWNILLRDSEGAHDPDRSRALCTKHGWDAVRAESIFWMVEMMESWFHADKRALEDFYGQGFRRQALAPNPEVEKIRKQDLESGLSAATRLTRKGDYNRHKTAHGPELLAKINARRVRAAAPNCAKMFNAILERLSSSE